MKDINKRTKKEYNKTMLNYREENRKRLIEYFQSGCKESKLLGVEVEHFVLDAQGKSIPYETLAPLILSAKRENEQCYYVNGVFLGYYDEQSYSVSFEPGMQLEVSIRPEKELDKIAAWYQDFYDRFSRLFKERGFTLTCMGYHPYQCADTIPLIPKRRYEFMDRYFLTHGTKGRQMMRATASTQVSIDYADEEDCARKMRLIYILSPILAMITDNAPMYEGEPVRGYSVRTQVWNDVDNVRCGILKEAFDPEFGFESYANHILRSPIILKVEGEQSVFTEDTALEDLSSNHVLTHDEVEHALSMFFFDVRLKHYLEIRIADSLPFEWMMAYVALIQGLFTNKVAFHILWEQYGQMSYEQVIHAREEMIKNGLDALVYGRKLQKIACELITLAEGTVERKRYLKPMKESIEQMHLHREPQIKKQEVWDKYYSFAGETPEDIASAKEELKYLSECSSLYHGMPTDTCYLAKLFSEEDIAYFRSLIQELYGIFDKVIERYESDVNYRQLFGFDKHLEELILRPRTYSSNLPVARIDIFYHEDTNTFEFCEFNTDGSSAMNEDRELCIAVQKTLPYQKLKEQYELQSFELFDSFINHFLNIYADYAENDSIPNIAIVDFMEQATVNEFKQFKKCFEERGIPTHICDIRELKRKDGGLYTPDGTHITAIYRRAVTSDIMNHYEEVQDFIEAVKANEVCLIGDFRTQIVHNKVVFEVLHHQDTMEMLTESERRFIIEHVPATMRMNEFLKAGHSLVEEKDQWIIKPQDSYGARGVYPGTLYTREEWEEILSQTDPEEYLVQRFYTPWCQKSYKLLHDGMEQTPFYHLTGLFVYDGEFQGVYSRVSRRKIISTQYSEIALPTFVIHDKGFMEKKEN